MSTESNGSKGSHRFQFRLRTLLFVTTGACILFGLLEFVIPDSIPIGYRIALYATYSIALAFAAWRVYESKRHPWKSPTEFVMVKVDAKWKSAHEVALYHWSNCGIDGRVVVVRAPYARVAWPGSNVGRR